MRHPRNWTETASWNTEVKGEEKTLADLNLLEEGEKKQEGEMKERKETKVKVGE